MATTGDQDTSGWYKVKITGGMTQAYASWREADQGDGLSVLSQYNDQWLYAGSWRASVWTAVNGQAKVYVTDYSGGHSPGDIVTHPFPNGGDFKVGTGAEIATSSGVQDFKLPHTGDAGNAKLITLEDSYGQIDRDYDDFDWKVSTQKLQLTAPTDVQGNPQFANAPDDQPGTNDVHLTWSDSNAVPVTFEMQRKNLSQNGDWQSVDGEISDTHDENMGPLPGRYDYRVRAVSYN